MMAKSNQIFKTVIDFFSRSSSFCTSISFALSIYMVNIKSIITRAYFANVIISFKNFLSRTIGVAPFADTCMKIKTTITKSSIFGQLDLSTSSTKGMFSRVCIPFSGSFARCLATLFASCFVDAGRILTALRAKTAGNVFSHSFSLVSSHVVKTSLTTYFSWLCSIFTVNTNSHNILPVYCVNGQH